MEKQTKMQTEKNTNRRKNPNRQIDRKANKHTHNRRHISIKYKTESWKRGQEAEKKSETIRCLKIR